VGQGPIELKPESVVDTLVPYLRRGLWREWEPIAQSVVRAVCGVTRQVQPSSTQRVLGPSRTRSGIHRLGPRRGLRAAAPCPPGAGTRSITRRPPDDLRLHLLELPMSGDPWIARHGAIFAYGDLLPLVALERSRVSTHRRSGLRALDFGGVLTWHAGLRLRPCLSRRARRLWCAMVP
jgi:hypothetical protein